MDMTQILAAQSLTDVAFDWITIAELLLKAAAIVIAMAIVVVTYVASKGRLGATFGAAGGAAIFAWAVWNVSDLMGMADQQVGATAYLQPLAILAGGYV